MNDLKMMVIIISMLVFCTVSVINTSIMYQAYKNSIVDKACYD